ncbi:Fluoride ion transporter CrcB [Methylomonas albis]|uniref:Fluoride-specific ion channel FluC n=1 Tax=Methylomonas albis TaxID=1854563 RepID=A0ABR9D4T9_9GAMM|nr:fluoride efflux transporter CrcB [Methylomonas albis]MBD9358142.1 fluoride efflux transporter CrcB [Methylomonas albis]CAD6881514.1 Fluoride ion transporter CrcB [Methylomonas albis]
MLQLFAVALGGAIGSMLRYLASSGVYLWLGRGFPYGTLTVNLLGSFLIGLMTEALILQRLAIALEYRTAILVGVMGGFTTFSSFSLETLYLLEQGQIGKAGLNIVVSVFGCLFAVWAGLALGKGLFFYSQGTFRLFDWPFPYALTLVNGIGAFLIGIVATVLMHKLAISIEYRAILVTVLMGLFITLSGLYLILYLLESGHSFESHMGAMLTVFLGNIVFCGAALWCGLWLGKQV